MNTEMNNEIGLRVKIMYNSSFNEVRPLVRSKLVNYEFSKDGLENMPYVRIMDLALTFGLWIEEMGIQISISNVCMDKWGVNVAELYIVAQENEKNAFGFVSLTDIIKEIASRNNNMEIELLPDDERFTEYVLTRDSKFLGAAAMARKDIFRKFAIEHDCEKIIILPSSIHELIIVIDGSCFTNNIDELREMVKEINDTQVEEWERLSYKVYVYELATDRIRVAE